jgi:hypothetical protein
MENADPIPETQRPPASIQARAERSLSDTVITIEFTLISIMAGVVLAPLAANSKDLLRDLRFEYWPYILYGLLYILFMWAGVVSHSFTFVGWPFELGHNLFYIAWTLVLAMQMNYLDDPRSWFALNILQTLVAGGIAIYDLRILRSKMPGVNGAEAALYRLALRRQVQLIRVLPIALGSALASLALLLVFPGFFIAGHWHWALAILQVLAVLAALVQMARSLETWRTPILQKEIAEFEEERNQ